jgi:spore coat protein H
MQTTQSARGELRGKSVRVQNRRFLHAEPAMNNQAAYVLQGCHEQLTRHPVDNPMTPTHHLATTFPRMVGFQKPRSISAVRRALLIVGMLVISHVAVGQERKSLTQIPRYELKMDSKNLRELERHADSDQTYPAKFLFEGAEHTVRVRYRGAWARSWPKKPLKIFFEDGKEFQGNHCLNLNSAWRDAAFVREPLAYQIYAACGVPASRSRMVELSINGQFHGLYVEVEQPDKPLFKRHNMKGVAIYKANSSENLSDERDLGNEKSFAANYEKETRKKESNGDLQLFCRELAKAKSVLEFFTNRVDVEEYINYLAASAFVQNWDGLNKNHFLVHDDRGSKKWMVVPWDLDRTFGDHWNDGFERADVPLLLGVRSLPGPTGWNRMADRFFSDATLRKRFLDRLEELLQKEFTVAKLFPILDQFESQLAEKAPRDRKRWPGPAGNLHGGIAEMKRFIEHRRAFLQREIAKLRRG